MFLTAEIRTLQGDVVGAMVLHESRHEPSWMGVGLMAVHGECCQIQVEIHAGNPLVSMTAPTRPVSDEEKERMRSAGITEEQIAAAEGTGEIAF